MWDGGCFGHFYLYYFYGMFQRKYTSLEIVRSLKLYCDVGSYRIASSKCNISKSSIQRWAKQIGGIGYAKTKRRIGKKAPKRKSKYHNVRTYVKELFQTQEVKYLAMHQIKEDVHSKFNFSPSLSCIRSILKDLKIGKKNFTKGIMTKDHETLYDERTSFLNKLKHISNERIICVDETGFSNVGNRMQIWFPKGAVPKDNVVLRKRERYSVCVGISVSGIVHYNKQPKAFNKLSFIAFLNELIPKLDTDAHYIIMDNVAFHRSAEIKELLVSHGLEPLFIPPYSPRCNPIEEVFSVIKRSFRKKMILSSAYEDSIQSELEKGYKDFSNYYNHTRSYEP